MFFSSPTLMPEALKSPKAKAILPTTLSSKELRSLGPEITEVATVSARVYEAGFLNKVAGIIENGMGRPEARLLLKQHLKEAGYQAPEGQRGRITDLSSDQRLNLIVETNADLSRGYGQWKQGQDKAILDAFPAQELFRAEDRIEPRPWAEIWTEAAAAVDEEALQIYKETGLFIARKDSEIWTQISDFGVPYPPFKFNSGMWTRDIDYNAAKGYGMDVSNIEQQDLNFSEAFQISAKDFPQNIADQLKDSLPDGFVIEDGILKKAA